MTSTTLVLVHLVEVDKLETELENLPSQGRNNSRTPGGRAVELLRDAILLGGGVEEGVAEASSVGGRLKRLPLYACARGSSPPEARGPRGATSLFSLNGV